MNYFIGVLLSSGKVNTSQWSLFISLVINFQEWPEATSKIINNVNLVRLEPKT